MSEAAETAPATPPADTPRPIVRRSGPTDIADPVIREEARKALVWAMVIGLVALAVVLAQPLLVVFGGLVFGSLIDGGARLLGRVLPIGRVWRVALVLLAVVGFAVWLVEFAGTQIADQASALPATIGNQAMKGMHWAQRHGLRMDAKFTQNLVEGALARVTEVTAVVGGVLGGMTTLFLILVLGIYFAIDPAPYRRGLAWMLPRESRDHFEGTMLVMGKALRRLLMGRLIGMMAEGLMIYIALALYGVPMAALLGMIAALLAFLPNIGAPISGLLMILVGFSGGTSMGLYCVGVFVVVMGVDGNVIVPLVAKRTADLAPALVLAMQLMMGLLFGIIGLALADPLLAMLKVLLERHSDRHAEAEAAT
ncbi:MAG: AI-2E family transporter [Proteobacteria bacterium]|nr:AI-2E family transporter [Pseudomonadota bacterium]